MIWHIHCVMVRELWLCMNRFVEKGNLEILLFSIQSQMRANNQKPYMPNEGRMISDINRAWEELERAEHERELALRDELVRCVVICRLSSVEWMKSTEIWASVLRITMYMYCVVSVLLLSACSLSPFSSWHCWLGERSTVKVLLKRVLEVYFWELA